MREGLTEVVEVTELPGVGRTAAHERPPDVGDHAIVAAVHACARPRSASRHREPRDGSGDRLRGRQHHARRDAPSVNPPCRGGGSSRISSLRAGYFKRVNGDVLRDPRVAVYVNDGRQHLQMQPPALLRSDHAGASADWLCRSGCALFEEFYALARTRLKAEGYVSQWLPAYQVPGATTLAMIRAFIDVFPQTVLISGAEADLLLLGANDSGIDIDPARVAAALSSAPAVKADLARVDLGSVREIVGTFVGSAQKLAEATRDSAPVSDDRPIQEYGVASLLDFGEAVPSVCRGPGAGRRVVSEVLRRRQTGSARGRARYLPGAPRSRLRFVSGGDGPHAPRHGSPGPPRRGQCVSGRHRSRVGGSAQHPGALVRSAGPVRGSDCRVPRSDATGARFGPDALAPGRGARVTRRARPRRSSTCADRCSSTPTTRSPGRICRPFSRLTRVAERP